MEIPDPDQKEIITDPGDLNVVDRTDPNPEHWRNYREIKVKKGYCESISGQAVHDHFQKGRGFGSDHIGGFG